MLVPDILNVTTLYDVKFWDNLLLYFELGPLGLWHKCDGCMSRVMVDLALQCWKVGLILTYHNYVLDKWDALCAADLTPKAFTHEKLINYGGLFLVLEKKGGDKEETRKFWE